MAATLLAGRALAGVLLAGAALAGTLLAGGATAASPDGKSAFSLADLGALVHLSKPVLSRDGSQAALIVSRPDLPQDRMLDTLVLVDVRSGAQRVMASGDVRDPAFSPAGDGLAWLAADADKITQIAVRPLVGTGDAPVVVTKATKGTEIRAFAWSPDGRSFAYLAPQAPAARVGEARFDRTFEVPDSDYLGTSYLARSSGAAPARLWVIPSRGGEARMLPPNTGHLVDLAWQRDGKAVMVVTRPGSSEVSARDGAVISVDVEQGTQTMVAPRPANVSVDDGMKISSQGVPAYLHYRGQDPWLHEKNVAAVDGRVRDLTSALDRDVIAFGWLPDGHTLLVEVLDHVHTALWTVPMSGAAHRLDLGTVNPDPGIAISGSGAVAFIGSEPSLPPELYVMASPTSKPRRLTHFNDSLLHARLGSMQAVAWKNDGYDQDGVLTYPPDFRPGRKYPLLVSIHGGPHTSSQLSFNEGSQFYAANGWLVFEPNYRGSSGQGEGYRTAVIDDATAGPGRDIRAGIAAVKAEGRVDAARVAVSGYSYGGVMTSWMIGRYHDWCAAIPSASVIDFADYYDQSETGIWIGSLLGSPHLAQNRRKYQEQSPATYLDQATTPTLIMQNVGDTNAPVGQAYTLYHALKDRGVESRFILSDIDGHGHGDPLHERQAYVLSLAWMNEHCGPAR